MDTKLCVRPQWKTNVFGFEEPTIALPGAFLLVSDIDAVMNCSPFEAKIKLSVFKPRSR